MSSPNDTHSLIISYLLGLLPEPELERFERSYLTNEDLFNELQEVEDELIDDYASGALTGEQRASFEKYFLRSSQRRVVGCTACRVAEGLVRQVQMC